jgi:hypothetical protein
LPSSLFIDISIFKQQQERDHQPQQGSFGNPLQQFSKFLLGDLGAGAAPAYLHLQLTAIGIRLNRIQVFHLSLKEFAANE